MRLTKQLYKCSEHRCLIPSDLELYHFPKGGRYVLSGTWLVSKAIERFIQSSYTVRTRLSDVSSDLSKLLRCIFEDRISHSDNAAHVQSILSSVSDDAVSSALRKLLPGRQQLREFVLRQVATYWDQEVESLLDSALGRAIEVEKKLAMLLISLDGTFDAADRLRHANETFKGVYLTLSNQFCEPGVDPILVPVENGEFMIKSLIDVVRRALQCEKVREVTHMHLVLCIDNTRKHKNLPDNFAEALDKALAPLLSEFDIEVEVELRECGFHLTKRWNKVRGHSDAALCRNVAKSIILACERGEHFVEAPRLSCDAYFEMHKSSTWDAARRTETRIQLQHFVSALSAALHSKYDYDSDVVQFDFCSDVQARLSDAVKHLGYAASHFLGRYVFFDGADESFIDSFVKLRIAEHTHMTVSFAALPRYVFESLVKKIGHEVTMPVCQSVRHLFAEWLCTKWFFSLLWNHHGDSTQPLGCTEEFKTRLRLCTSVESLTTQYANSLNSNPKHWGNATLNEAQHRYMNAHKISAPSSIELKLTAVRVIAMKQIKLVRFNEAHHDCGSDGNLRKWEQVLLSDVRGALLSLPMGESGSIQRLRDHAPLDVRSFLQERGFKAIVKAKSFTDNRVQHLITHRPPAASLHQRIETFSASAQSPGIPEAAQMLQAAESGMSAADGQGGPTAAQLAHSNSNSSSRARPKLRQRASGLKGN